MKLSQYHEGLSTGEKFIIASRLDTMFANPNGGVLSLTDLWSRSLETLNTMANALHSELDSQQIDFLAQDEPSNKSIGRKELKLKFDIVLYILRTKNEERRLEQAARETAIKRNRIMELIAKREDDELAGKSVDELRALIDSM